MKKSTMQVFVVLAVIVGGTYASYRVINFTSVQRFVNERQAFCANLTSALQLQEGVEDCYCYYEGFKTEDPNLDGNTMPLCACECVVNGSPVKIGLLEPKA